MVPHPSLWLCAYLLHLEWASNSGRNIGIILFA